MHNVLFYKRKNTSNRKELNYMKVSEERCFALGVIQIEFSNYKRRIMLC